MAHHTFKSVYFLSTMLDMAEKHEPNLYAIPRKESDTIVIDNGTFELKAGYLGELSLAVKNKLFRTKEKTSFEAFPCATTKTMFDGDVVTGFDVLELEVDMVLDYLRPSSFKNLIITSTPYSPTEMDMLEFLFEVYDVERVQIGYDFIYCYHKYFDKQDCVIVDMKYSSTIVCVVKNNRIEEIYKINFGGSDLIEYINHSVADRCKDARKDWGGLLDLVRVPMNYEKEALRVYQEMCNGIYDSNVFLTEGTGAWMPGMKAADRPQVAKKPRPLVIPKLDYGLLGQSDESAGKEELKERRKTKMLYYGTLARVRSKIDDLFRELDESVEWFREEFEKKSNPNKYIAKKKERFRDLKRELEEREQIRRDVRNKKTNEFVVKNKDGMLSEEEQAIKNRILDAEDEEKEERLVRKIDELVEEILVLDPDFVAYHANAVEILRGDNIGRLCINVDLLRWPEIFFDPSIIGSEQMGLSEIFENIFPKAGINNMLVCGGLSFMPGLLERIESEVQSLLGSGGLNLVKAGNPREDPFYGARFSELFPVHSRPTKK